MRTNTLPALTVLAATLVVFSTTDAAVRGQNAREQTLFVGVVDKDGVPVNDLGLRDFVVREDGVAREVLRVARAVEPIDIALLVDDSTAAEPELIHIREALTRFVDLMHREHNVAIVGLAARPTILSDYTHSVSQLKAAIGRVFPQSDTGMTLLDALVEVSKGLERREAPRAAVVAVLTDGPELGRYDDRTVIQAVKKAGAAFHAVTVGTFSSTMPEEMRYRALVLAEGTRETGGRHDNLLAGSGLPQALERVARELLSQYKVVYGRPESLIPPESVEVTVTRPGLAARSTPARRSGGQL